MGTLKDKICHLNSVEETKKMIDKNLQKLSIKDKCKSSKDHIF